MPDFIDELAAVLTGEPLREKILLAPSHRVGRQWLDRAALAAGGVANVRALTVKRLLLDYAEPALRRDGLRPASEPEKLRLAGIALARLGSERRRAGYFTRLHPSLGLTQTLLSTLEELASANVTGSSGIMNGVASRDKAEELAELARLYRAALGREKLTGPAEICRAAMRGAAERKEWPLLIVPESVLEDLTPLEWGFLSRWPDGSRRRLADAGGGPAAEFGFISADSVANEAREVLRRIRAAGLPLDAAEVVCLDGAAYVPALIAAGLETFGGAPEDLPFTVSGGLPGSYARPARALAAWLDWIESDLPPEGLARMIESGLLGDTAEGVSEATLAARLRALPINGGAGDYGRNLAAAGDSPLSRAEARLARLIADIVPRGRDGSLELSDAGEVLRAAAAVLGLGAGEDGKLDAYARLALSESVAAWRGCCDWPGFDACVWLGGLVRDLRVMGLGPMPGRLHISELRGGGESGREWLFVLGMDDTRYPGSTRQDPVLLDRERPAVSPNLVKSHQRRERREKAFARLLARAKGKVWLCHARHDAAGGRELFPAALFTRLAGDAVADNVALRPETAEKCLCRRDDWLHILLAAPRNLLTPAELAPWFPALAAGGRAEAARASEKFTAYDGRVPEAGEDFRRDGWALSPTDMETLAKCPRDFFFKKVLGIRPPDRYEPTPGRWLEPNERGNLLHDLFQDFLTALMREDERVRPDNFRPLLERLAAMLEKSLGRQYRNRPPLDPLAHRREEDELLAAATIFLREEAGRQAVARPIRLEVSIGGAKEDDPPLGRVEPVELALPSGAVLRLKGRVDRIDRLDDHGGLMIYDYKTGSSAKYSSSDPFRQGRTLQPYLYVLMAERALRDAGLEEPVRGFSYLFPMPRDEGREIRYTRELLRDGGTEILETLAGLLAAGDYPLSDDRGDLTYSDYLPLHGEPGEATALAGVKARGDAALEGWSDLRTKKRK